MHRPEPAVAGRLADQPERGAPDQDRVAAALVVVGRDDDRPALADGRVEQRRGSASIGDQRLVAEQRRGPPRPSDPTASNPTWSELDSPRSGRRVDDPPLAAPVDRPPRSRRRQRPGRRPRRPARPRPSRRGRAGASAARRSSRGACRHRTASRRPAARTSPVTPVMPASSHRRGAAVALPAAVRRSPAPVRASARHCRRSARRRSRPGSPARSRPALARPGRARPARAAARGPPRSTPASSSRARRSACVLRDPTAPT